jgi:hypothetical protein
MGGVEAPAQTDLYALGERPSAVVHAATSSVSAVCSLARKEVTSGYVASLPTTSANPRQRDW